MQVGAIGHTGAWQDQCHIAEVLDKYAFCTDSLCVRSKPRHCDAVSVWWLREPDWQELSFKTRLSSKKCLLQREGWPEGSGDMSSQFSAGGGDSWSLEGDLVTPFWTFPSFISTTFYQEVLSVTWALWINKVALYIDYSHERAQQLLWSHYSLLFGGSRDTVHRACLLLSLVELLHPCGSAAFTLWELSAFTPTQEQRWNKTLSLFMMLNPCLQSIVLIVQSLQLIKYIVKLLLEKKSLCMGSSYFPRQKCLIIFNILPPCTPEQKSVFRIYRKKLMQDLLVFKRHHLLLLSICIFICVLKAKKGEKSPPVPFSTLDWGPVCQVSSGTEFFYKWVIIKPWK